jgi:AraC-like DNA-binding protein
MMYLERRPANLLSGPVRMLWYARAGAISGRERILPHGCVQVILTLARDFIHECVEDGPAIRMPAALVVGARSVYEIIDRADMAELIGIVFEPGGFPSFVRERADLFSNRSVALDDVWGASANLLRDRLREARTAEAKLALVQDFLSARFVPDTNPLVRFAIRRFSEAQFGLSVAEVAAESGWSQRRFSQVFREQVGLTPTAWRRIQRFQRAVRQLHSGVDVAWAELALDCGYYDQSHFANEFRAFSGIDATTYSARRTQWANHAQV